VANTYSSSSHSFFGLNTELNFSPRITYQFFQKICIFVVRGTFFAGKFFAGRFFAGRFFARKKFPRRRKILCRSILHPDNSSPDNSSQGYFFARKILRRMILRRKVLRQRATDIFSLGRKTLRRIVLRWKVLFRRVRIRAIEGPIWSAKTVFANNNNILNEKITVALRRRFIRAKNFSAKNCPAKNFPPQRKNIGSSLAKDFPSKKSSGRRILRRRIFRPDKKITLAKISPVKNHTSEELFDEELSGEEFS
jgi:hypothetical protein